MITSLWQLVVDKFVYSKDRSLGVGWSEARKRYLLKHPGCEICGYVSTKFKPSNDIHHIVPRHIDPSRLLDEGNFMTLCRRYKCHLRFGHFGDYQRYWNPRVKEMFVGCGGMMAKEEADVRGARERGVIGFFPTLWRWFKKIISCVRHSDDV